MQYAAFLVLGGGKLPLLRSAKILMLLLVDERQTGAIHQRLLVISSEVDSEKY